MYKILIVEDEILIRNWLVAFLGNSRKDLLIVGEANNGKEGSEKIKDLLPDIVITDISMPIMDAFDMFEATEEINYEKIILSGYNDFDNAKKAMRYEVFDFIAKPIDKNELNTVIDKIIDQIEITREKSVNQIIDLPSSAVFDGIVNDAIEWIHLNYHLSIKIRDIAHEIGVSESNLYKKFKEQTTMTINDYITKYKIMKAIQRLYQEPDIKVYELASDLGFSDISYFRQVFKKHTLLSIVEFRDLIK